MAILAVDLGGTKVAVASIQPRGRKIRARLTEPVDTSSPEAPIGQIVRLARSLDDDLEAAGIAVPGLVRRDGTVWAPNLRGWDRVPLAKSLRTRLRIPVTVESDRNAAVLGEVWAGTGQGQSDVIALIIGTGIGAGILSGGRIVRGAHELSGCAGWMVVTEEENELTRTVGSLESVTAGPAIARLSKRFSTAEDVAEAARKGDGAARAVFARVAELLGSAIANLISLFDPEMIVIGGGMAGAADLYLDDLRRFAMERAQPLAAKQVSIVVSKLGNDANLLGAAKVAIDGARRTR